MSKFTTNNIEVVVESMYIPTQTVDSVNCYGWEYYVKIKNLGTDTVQLVNRSWEVFDRTGCKHKVIGAGVIGRQPVLKASEDFSYVSGVTLYTRSGMMVGLYEFKNLSTGKDFVVNIPPICLEILGVKYIAN